MQPGARTVGRIVIAAAVIGLVASLLGGITGVALVGSFDDAVSGSLDVTIDTIGTVDRSLAVAADALGLVDDGLADSRSTAGDVVEAVGTGATLLRSTADLTESELAPSVSAVEQALPDLVTVASGIDTALGALSRLPVGVQYDAEAGLDEAIRDVQTSLEGTGGQLREQAGLIRDAGDELDAVAAGGDAIVERADELSASIARASTLLDDYAASAADALALVTEARDQVQTRTAVAVTLVIAIAIAVALSQLGPLWIGIQLVRNAERIDDILA